jgi:hypothetical protein
VNTVTNLMVPQKAVDQLRDHHLVKKDCSMPTNSSLHLHTPHSLINLITINYTVAEPKVQHC